MSIRGGKIISTAVTIVGDSFIAGAGDHRTEMGVFTSPETLQIFFARRRALGSADFCGDSGSTGRFSLSFPAG